MVAPVLIKRSEWLASRIALYEVILISITDSHGRN